MPPRYRTLLAASALLGSLALGARPQQSADFETQHAAALAASPADLHLHLALAGGRTQFHRGELIKVEYHLTADAPEKYRSGDLWFDLSERSRFESFYSDRPADAADPLAGHWTIWETLYDVHVTRRLGTWKKLSQDPLIEPWGLNEYMRFDKPGKYRIFAVTRHVVTDWTPGHNAYAGGPPLASDVLELEILPDDPAWAAETLQRALETFTLAVKDVHARASALKTIRFLDTPESLEAMAAHYTGVDREADTQFLSGLIGYHDRAAAVHRMESQLNAPEFGVSRFFLFSLAVMKLCLAHPELTAEMLQAADKPLQKQWRHALFDVLMPYYSQLMAQAEKKFPRARALTVDTLFHTSAQESFAFERLPLPADQVEALRLRELAVLSDLPLYEQMDRISNFGWAKNLPPDQVVAALRKIYEHPAGELSGDIERARNTVVKNVSQISPEEGQKMLAMAISEPVAPMRARDAAAVSLTPSPELDKMLMEKLEGRRTEEMKSAAPLIGKYASPAVRDRVRAVYEVENEAWPCDIEAGLLAYFLRVDEPYALRMLPAALQFAASRERLTCQRPSLVGAISESYYSAAIEKAAIAALDDPNPQFAIDAATTLAAHPSDAAQAAVLDRLRRFHDEWQGFDLQSASPDSKHNWEVRHQAGLQMELVRALARSGAYRRHPDKLDELAKLCVTDTCRSEIQRMAH